MWRVVYRYVLPALLPTVSAAASAIAGAAGYPDRVYWSLAAIAFIAGSATITTLSTRQADTAKRAAVTAKANLGGALAGAGQPLVVALADLSAAPDSAERSQKLAVLEARIVEIAKVQCGQDAPGRPSQRVRAAFYEFDDENLKVLTCRIAEGRGGAAPRDNFRYGTSQDDGVISFAKGKNALRVNDITVDAPSYFDRVGRTFKSYIAVPVRAGDRPFGFIAVDSEAENSFTALDVGYLQLLAGLLAAGLAQTRADPSAPPGPTVSGSSSSGGE